MPDDTTPTAEEIAVFNERFIRGLDQDAVESCKTASVEGSNMIRLRIRENGFFRHIIPIKPVTDADLDRSLTSELPRMIEDMESASPGSVSIPFNGSPESVTYRGAKFEIVFSKLATREYVKNVDELRTYKMDLRQLTTDNALKDMQTEEDARLIKTADRVVGSVGGVGESNENQNTLIAGAITRSTYPYLKNNLQDLNLNIGVYLMNRHTAVTFETWGRDEIGGDLSQKIFEEGLAGMDKFKIGGVPHIATIKRDLVPDNVVYQFTEPGYLGRFYSLEDVTMFVERRKDILRFSAHEKIGMQIANVRGIFKTSFTS